jgi:tetratricopeptide (TPR) repeat protein
VTEALQQEIRTLRSLYQSERDPEGRVFAPLADAYRRAGQIPEAFRLLKEGLPRHPEFVTGHVVAAQLYVEQGLAEEGAIAARRALELDHENVNALQSLLSVLGARGEEGEAGALRDRLVSLEPDFAGGASVLTRAAAPATVLDVAPQRDARQRGPRDEEGAFTIEAEPSASFEETAWSAPAPEREPALLDADASLEMFTLAPEEPTLDLADLGAEEPTVSLSSLVTEEEASDLLALVPEPERVLDLGAISLEDVDIPTAPRDVSRWDALAQDPEPVFDIGALGPAALQETMFVGAVPGADPVLDMGLLAPDTESEPVLDMAALAPEAEAEPVLDMAALAPEAEAEPVLDMAALAPEAEAEPVLDMAALAPEAEAEPVLDMAALAPEAEAEPVLDMAALAPEAEAEPVAEPVLDMGLLAPEPETDPVMNMAALAPDPGSDPAGVVLIMKDEPDDIVIDMDALGPGSSAPEESAADDDPVADESPEEGNTDVPLHTRTLAELYVKQGAIDRALVVLRHLRDADPRDPDIAQRIHELERDVVGGGASGESLPEPEEEVETLARDLAQSGHGRDEVDTPFAWGETEPEEAAPGPTIREYFDGMLTWEPGERP